MALNRAPVQVKRLRHPWNLMMEMESRIYTTIMEYGTRWFEALAAELDGQTPPEALFKWVDPPRDLEANLFADAEWCYRQGWKQASLLIGRQLKRKKDEILRSLQSQSAVVVLADLDKVEKIVQKEADVGDLMVPKEGIDWYSHNWTPKMAGQVEDSTRRMVNDTVSSMALEGKELKVAREQLQRQLRSDLQWRANIIARTESSNLYNHAHYSRFRATKAVKGWRFDAIVDSRTTDICEWHDGTEWDLEDNTAPLPPLHYQCRSTLAPILFHEDPEYLSSDDIPSEVKPQSGFHSVLWSKEYGANKALDYTTSDLPAWVKEIADEPVGDVSNRATTHEEWLSSLSSEERQRIKRYTGKKYRDILKCGARGESEEWETYRTVRNALKTAPDYEGGTVYRGTYMEPEKLEAFLQRDKLTLDVFRSASIEKRVGEKYAVPGRPGTEGVLLEVRGAKRAIEVIDLSYYTSESEVILHEGTSYRIVSSEKTVNYTKVVLEEVTE